MIYFFGTFLFSLILTYAVKIFATRLNIVDKPDYDLKKHNRIVPLLGGTAIFLSFWLIVFYILHFTDLFGKNLDNGALVGTFFASLPLMIIGFVDDKYRISARWRLGLAALCALGVVVSGVWPDKITNPFGGVLPLYLHLFSYSTENFGIAIPVGGVLAFFWILGMMFTTKILDGLDGLSTGITTIASVMIFFIANGERWHQPDVALLALVFAGACMGFLVFNFYPAKIFLGEGGSLFIGFMLGVLSVISGGKIATALLVMAIPILDLARVAIVRYRRGQSIFKGDREHLHFKLLDIGLSQRQAVLVLYSVALLFGVTTLFFQSLQKFYALLVLFLLMILCGFWINEKTKKYGRKKGD